MKKTIRSIFVLSLLAGSTLSGASISFSNFDGGFVANLPVGDSGDSAIASGAGFAAIGFFTLSDSAISDSYLSLSSFQALKDDFNQFGTGISFGGATAFNLGGLYNGDASGSIAEHDAFDGQVIYTFIGNGADFASSTELSVVKSTKSFAYDNPTFVETVDISKEGTALLGDTGAFDIGGGVVPTLLTVAAVPEPSTYAALAGLCALGAVTLRRRRA